MPTDLLSLGSVQKTWQKGKGRKRSGLRLNTSAGRIESWTRAPVLHKLNTEIFFFSCHARVERQVPEKCCCLVIQTLLHSPECSSHYFSISLDFNFAGNAEKFPSKKNQLPMQKLLIWKCHQWLFQLFTYSLSPLPNVEISLHCLFPTNPPIFPKHHFSDNDTHSHWC